MVFLWLLIPVHNSIIIHFEWTQSRNWFWVCHRCTDSAGWWCHEDCLPDMIFCPNLQQYVIDCSMLYGSAMWYSCLMSGFCCVFILISSFQIREYMITYHMMSYSNPVCLMMVNRFKQRPKNTIMILRMHPHHKISKKGKATKVSFCRELGTQMVAPSD
jgi:hypothetical protein